MEFKHHLNSLIKYNNLNYKLELYLDNNSNIVSSKFTNERGLFDSNILIGQNISNLDLRELVLGENEFILYFLISKLAFIPVVEVLDIHCRCLGISKIELLNSINSHDSFKDLLADLEVSTRCTSCLENTIEIWSKTTNINPKVSIKKIKGKFEVAYVKEISSFLQNYKVYKLAYPNLYLHPLDVDELSNKSYKKSLQQVAKILKDKFDLDFLVQFIF